MKWERDLDTGSRRAGCLVTGILAVLLSALDATAADDIFAVQSRLSTPNFQLFHQLNDDATVGVSSPLFLVQGGVYGAAFLEGTFYGIELENDTFVDYLVTVPHEGPGFAQRNRVGSEPVGFPNVEALANVNGTLVGASVQSPAHRTEFISIDSLSGVGTSLGVGSTDVLIFGLAYDPVGGVLYGASKPFATVSGFNLWTIDPATGATTLVGPLGVKVESLTWSATHGLIGAFEHLYEIDTATGAATQIGETAYHDNKPGTLNGVYALAAIPPAAPAVPFQLVSVSHSDGAIMVEWTSEAGFNYQLEFSETGQDGTWSFVSEVMPGTPGTMSATHIPGVAEGLYRVVRTVP